MSLTKKIDYSNLEVLYKLVKSVKKKKKGREKTHRATPMPPSLYEHHLLRG